MACYFSEEEKRVAENDVEIASLAAIYLGF